MSGAQGTVRSTPGHRGIRVRTDHGRRPWARAIAWVSDRMMGVDRADPASVLANNVAVASGLGALEASARLWRSVPRDLVHLVELAVAVEVGCTWCIDYGVYESTHRGIDPDKLRAIHEWRTSPVYSDLERAVLAFAVAATRTPAEVTDEMVEALRPGLSDRGIVELAARVSLENLRSRTNAALGLTSQGFSDSCAVTVAEVAGGGRAR